MPFDGIVTRAVVEELQTEFRKGRITKLHQPTKTELIFTIRYEGKNISLLFSIHPTYARLHVTENKFKNPKHLPVSCMHLLKNLLSGFIAYINQEVMVTS